MKNPLQNEIIQKTITTLFLNKAEDVVLIDLQKFKALLDDVLIICTCQSEVQMRSVLRKCEKVSQIAKAGQTRIEYSSGVKWGILKTENFILHVFENETRGYYSLERLWGDATLYELKAEDYPSNVDDVDNNSELTLDDENEFL